MVDERVEGILLLLKADFLLLLEDELVVQEGFDELLGAMG